MNKLLHLPQKLLQFWYPESLLIILRSWKNSLLYLEEDLAVGLMFKLLFTPLFHDSSLVGKALSFLFRLFRVVLGLTAFLLVSQIALTLGLIWFSLPITAFLITGYLGLVLKLLLISAVILFLNYYLTHPDKKLWQLKDPADIWQATFVKKEDATVNNLLRSFQVQNLLAYLEINDNSFSDLPKSLGEEEQNHQILELGQRLKLDYIDKEHLFVAFLKSIPNIDGFLLKHQLKLSDFEEALDFLRQKQQRWRRFYIWDEGFRVKHLKGVNRGWLGVPTPLLDTVSEDLTKKAATQNIADFIGREAVVHQLIRLLSQEGKRNAIISGEAGSGKSQLVEYLAKLIISGDAPEALAIKRLVRLDITKLLAGVTAQGELADKIETIFTEVKNSDNVILFVDEIHNLGVGEVGEQMNVYSLILPYLDSSDYQFLANLSEEVADNPYCLILLDEFEKAEPRILNIFLQILDDARLSSAEGKLIDFRNAIIIATSNAGSTTIAKGIQAKESLARLKTEVKDELMKVFKIELINRFDEVVLFKPLSREDLQQIVRLKLAELREKLNEQGYEVDFNEELLNELVSKGYDPVLGARPLRRLIQDTIEANLAAKILKSSLPKGERINLGLEFLQDT